MAPYRRFFGPLLAALVIVAAVLPASAASAASDDVERAQEWYKAAMAHMKAERFAKAAIAFEEAYRLDPNPVLMWNVARAYEKADDLEAAKQWYEDFLKHESVEGDLRAKAANAMARIAVELEKRRLLAEQKRKEAELQKKVAELEAAKKKAEEDKIRERERLKAEMAEEVARKQREEAARRAAEAEAQRKAEEAAKKKAEEDAKGERDRDTASLLKKDQPSGPPPEEPSNGMTIGGAVSIGLGAVLGGVGAFLFVNAESLRDDVATAKRNAEGGLVTDMTRGEALAAQSDANLQQTLGVVGIGVGGAALVTGVILLAIGDPEPPSTRLSTEVADGHVMLNLSGEF